MLLEAIALSPHTTMSPLPVVESHFTTTYTCCPLAGRVPTKQPLPDHFPTCFFDEDIGTKKRERGKSAKLCQQMTRVPSIAYQI